jgi:ElaA protein
MAFYAKFFPELTSGEVYEILKSRAEIFVKEQKIIYVDEDNVDYESLHCFLTDEETGRVMAYFRAYRDVEDAGEVKIGRVLTVKHGVGDGKRLMRAGIAAIIERMPCRKIVMDAQKHAVGFYEKLGFLVTSDEFFEEGIVHVKMSMDI